MGRIYRDGSKNTLSVLPIDVGYERCQPRALFLESPVRFSGLESQFLFAVFAFKIKVSKIFAMIE